MANGKLHEPKLSESLSSASPELVQEIERLRQKLAAKDRAINALRCETERWRSLTAISAGCYWQQDEQFRLTAISDAAEPLQTSGASHQSIGLCRWSREDAIPLTMPWDEHKAVLEAHQPFKGFEYQILDGEGKQTYVSVNGVPIFDRDGKFKGYLGSTTDITEQKRLETRAGEGAHFLNEIVENIPVAVHLLAVEDGLRIVGWNKAASHLFGLTRAEAMGKTMAELALIDAAADQKGGCVERVLRGELLDIADRPQPTRGRGVIRVRARRAPLTGPDGQVTHILCTTEDITERLASQEQLRQSEARYRAVVSALVEAVVLRDAEGRIVDCNQSTERIFGQTADELRGGLRLRPNWQQLREDGSVMPAEEHPEVMAIRTGMPQTGSLVCYKKPNGSEMWAHFNVQPLFDQNGNKPSGFVSSLSDITTRKNAELEIVRLNVTLEKRVLRRTAELESANRELEAFSYSVAHDLRSPLGAIDGFCSLLQKAISADADQRALHCLNRIRMGVHRMGELTNGLLSLAKLSRTSLNWGTVDISVEAAQILKELAENDSMRTVTVVVQPALAVRGDRALLRQVLENLIANAWKFTSRRADAEICIGVNVSADLAPAYFVQDNGAGFDMAYADKLFGTFQRLHTVDEFAGSGIGLATVHRIISRHGGRIWAKSAVDEGCTFYFTLGGEQDQMGIGLTADAELQPPTDALIVLGGSHRASASGGYFARPQDLLGGDSGVVSSSDQQFSRAFDYAPIGMALVGLDSRRLKVNSAFCRMLGYSEAEMMSRTTHHITHPDDIHWDLLQRQRALAGEIENYQWEKRYIHQSGRVVWAYLTCSLVRDADRKPIHFIAQVLDITDQKERERILRETEERFRDLITLSSDWFWEQDKNLRFIRTSGDNALKGGVTLDRIVGKLRWELPWVGYDEKDWKAHKAQLERRETFRDLELDRYDENGALRHVSISGTPIFDAFGNLTGYSGVGRDITEVKRSDRMKSEVIATVSDELLPALVTVRDTLEQICAHTECRLPPDLLTIALAAKRDCERLMRLTSNMLNSDNMRAVNAAPRLI